MTALLFTVVALVMAVAHLAAAGFSGRRLKHPKEKLSRDLFIAAGAIVAVLAIPAFLAQSGVTTDFSGTPPNMLRLMLVCAGTTVALALSPYGRRLATGLPLWVLVGYQVFRLPVELLLHSLYSEGLLPVHMTYLGRNFDAVTAVTAAGVAWLAWKGKLTRPVLIGWNLLGLGLLLNVAGMGMLTFPSPFRVFTDDPSNAILAEAPYIWLPTFLVTTALFGHLLVFRCYPGEDGSRGRVDPVRH
ncbi:MAG: hypothetical protein FJW39_06435 [Acidobacteria bacterium]|nr:hypothetical protein [Acidobacteriota bacterium]